MAIHELDLAPGLARADQPCSDHPPVGGPLQLSVTAAIIVVPFVGALLAMTGVSHTVGGPPSATLDHCA